MNIILYFSEKSNIEFVRFKALQKEKYSLSEEGIPYPTLFISLAGLLVTIPEEFNELSTEQ